MKTTLKALLVGLVMIAFGPVWGAEPEGPEPLNRNRFSLSFDAGFNVRAEFDNLAPNVDPPPSTGSGLTSNAVDRTYDDGYNRVDFFDNGGGLTWNWGYKNDSQYDDVNRTLALNATTRSGSGTSTTAADDPQLGFELKYGRVIGVLGENKPWGLEGAFSYMNLSIKDDTVLSTVQRVTDTYALGVVIPPPAPYQGTFNGPGPLIADLPLRSVETASLSTWNDLSGNLFALRVGPFLEIPLSSRFAGQIGAGVSLIYADTDYSYSETATFVDGSSVVDSGSDASSDVLFGGYLQGQIGYLLSGQWSIFGGVRLETASDLRTTAGNREASLQLGGTIHAILGVGYSF